MMIGGLVVMWPQAERQRSQGGYAAVMRPGGSANRPRFSRAYDLTTRVRDAARGRVRSRADGRVARRRAAARRGMHDSSIVRDSTNLFAMDQQAAQQVARPPKPGAPPSMTPLERDALERRIHCQCGCTLDVFTCRTTDFSCQVSPAMHRDVVALVQGGYSAQEIIDAFVGTYGQRVLDGADQVRLQSGRVVYAWHCAARGRGRGGDRRAPASHSPGRERGDGQRRPVGATSDELSRLDAAVRGDGEA